MKKFRNGSALEGVGGFYFGGNTPFWLDHDKTKGFENPFTNKFSTSNLIIANRIFERKA
jgi:hypothetical protein